MTKPATKLEIAIAEMSVLLKTVVTDVAEIKARLDIMDKEYAKREEVRSIQADIITLRNTAQALEIKVETHKAQMKTWGLVGAAAVTIIAAILGTIHL